MFQALSIDFTCRSSTLTIHLPPERKIDCRRSTTLFQRNVPGPCEPLEWIRAFIDVVAGVIVDCTAVDVASNTRATVCLEVERWRKADLDLEGSSRCHLDVAFVGSIAAHILLGVDSDVMVDFSKIVAVGILDDDLNIVDNHVVFVERR